MFRLTQVIVRLRSEPLGFSSIITYSSGGFWSVWSGGCPYTDMNEILKTYIKKFYLLCLTTYFAQDYTKLILDELPVVTRLYSSYKNVVIQIQQGYECMYGH
jgi:hypothetical protein